MTRSQLNTRSKEFDRTNPEIPTRWQNCWDLTGKSTLDQPVTPGEFPTVLGSMTAVIATTFVGANAMICLVEHVAHNEIGLP